MKNEQQLRKDLKNNLNGIGDDYIRWLVENCVDDCDLETDFDKEDFENLKNFVKDEELTEYYKCVEMNLNDFYEKYFKREEFLNKRGSALCLINYLIGLWDINLDEVDFKK